MNASTKTFIASLIIFACSLGFFIGAFAFNNAGFSTCSKNGICEFQPGDCCKKNMDCCKKKADCCKKKAPCGPDCKCPRCMRHGEEFGEGPHHKGDHFRGEPPRDPNFKGKHFDKKFDKKFDFKKGEAFMDSVLQVTPEQKAALEQQRRMMDSTFKELRKQKKEAETTLREALDSNDDKKIAAAKANILKAQEGLLNHRIKGVKDFNKILTKEQLEKFKSMQFEHMKHAKHGKGEHGPEHHEQPQD